MIQIELNWYWKCQTWFEEKTMHFAKVKVNKRLWTQNLLGEIENFPRNRLLLNIWRSRPFYVFLLELEEKEKCISFLCMRLCRSCPQIIFCRKKIPSLYFWQNIWDGRCYYIWLLTLRRKRYRSTDINFFLLWWLWTIYKTVL